MTTDGQPNQRTAIARAADVTRLALPMLMLAAALTLLSGCGGGSDYHSCGASIPSRDIPSSNMAGTC